jgi:hypothetical protein
LNSIGVTAFVLKIPFSSGRKIHPTRSNIPPRTFSGQCDLFVVLRPTME